MIGSWIESAWHFIFGWPAVDILVGVAALVVAALEPPIVAAIIPDLRKWAIAVAVVAFTFISISGKFYHDGLAEKQSQWNAAVAAEAVQGESDRSNAVAAVRALPPDGMRNDKWNRDNRGSKPASVAKSPVRWLARHRIFGK